jgi:hypothetical protein
MFQKTTLDLALECALLGTTDLRLLTLSNRVAGRRETFRKDRTDSAQHRGRETRRLLEASKRMSLSLTSPPFRSPTIREAFTASLRRVALKVVVKRQVDRAESADSQK